MTFEELTKLDKNQLTYQRSIEIIDQLFPEYRTAEKYYDKRNETLPYLYLGCLSLMALENLEASNDIHLAIRLINVTNYLVNNGDEGLQDLFCIEIFEKLTRSKKGARLAQECLTGKALQLFHTTTLSYHTDAFLKEYFFVFKKHPIFSSDPPALYAYMNNELVHPKIQPPKDSPSLLKMALDLTNLEKYVLSVLQCLTSKNDVDAMQVLEIRALLVTLSQYRWQLNTQWPDSSLYKPFLDELLVFIDDLERITTNVSNWIWNHLKK